MGVGLVKRSEEYIHHHEKEAKATAGRGCDLTHANNSVDERQTYDVRNRITTYKDEDSRSPKSRLLSKMEHWWIFTYEIKTGSNLSLSEATRLDVHLYGGIVRLLLVHRASSSIRWCMGGGRRCVPIWFFLPSQREEVRGSDNKQHINQYCCLFRIQDRVLFFERAR